MRPPTPMRLPPLLLPGLLALSAAGCGTYHPADEKGLYPPEWRTVAVPIAQNLTFWPDIERSLTEATLKELAVRTPYGLLDSSKAQTILRLKITGVKQTVLSRRESGLPQELEMMMTVDMDWVDATTGKVIRSRHGLQGPGRYVPSRGEQETNAVAGREAAERLARDIVDAMRSDW